MGSRSDTRLEERAIRERWPIPPAARVNILRRLLGILRDPKATKRDLINAARVLATLDGINLKQMELDIASGVSNAEAMERIVKEALGRAEYGSDGDVGAADPPNQA